MTASPEKRELIARLRRLIRIDDLAAALGAASRELAEAIERGANPPPGWNIGPWGKHVARQVELARIKRDAAAQQYRAAIVALQRALQDRKRGFWVEREETRP